jgi:membrane protein YqaA with SNARE-associated domain
VTESLLAMFGLYGGACLVGFCAGMFPIISIELFLIGIATWAMPSPLGLATIVVLAAVGHQIAKTIFYVAGIGALEKSSGKLKARVDAARAKIDRWNRRPKVFMFFAATIGLPPLYVLAFVARPLLNMELIPFTVITLGGRIGRYAVLMLVPGLIGA